MLSSPATEESSEIQEATTSGLPKNDSLPVRKEVMAMSKHWSEVAVPENLTSATRNRTLSFNGGFCLLPETNLLCLGLCV